MSSYTEGERSQAVGLALAIGPKRAAEQLGIPRRTISYWLARGAFTPAVEAALVATEEAIAERLWDTFTLGLEQVRAGLKDANARLGDKARALEVVAAQWQLLTGRATART